MMKKGIVIFILLCHTALYSENWSKNGVWKYHASRLFQRNSLLDYENLDLQNYYFSSLSQAESWIRTPNIFVGTDYVVKDMFVNTDSIDTNDRIIFQLRQSDNDRLLEQGFIRGNSLIPLFNIFEKNIYLTMYFSSTNLKVYSFGITRQPELVVQKKELVLNPSLLFFGEEELEISLKLRFPAWLDIIIFDQNGTVIDNILKSEFYREGDYHFKWSPTQSSYPTLASGIYLVYIKTYSTEGKTVELESDFWMINR